MFPPMTLNVSLRFVRILENCKSCWCLVVGCNSVVEILSLDSAWSHLSCIDVSEDSRQLAPAPGPDGQAGPELTLTLGAGVLTPEPEPGRGRGGREVSGQTFARTCWTSLTQCGVSWCFNMTVFFLSCISLVKVFSLCIL